MPGDTADVPPRIGSHVSTRGGYRAAAEAAAAIGGNAFQYFPKNPRSVGVKAWDVGDAANCKIWCGERGVVSVAHGPYPINPAADGERAERMALSTLNDLAIAESCGSLGVVVHFGVCKGTDPLQGYRNMIRWLDEVTAAWSGSALILLENGAGNHGPMGTTPEELAQVRSLCRKPDRIGFCLDTCHLFASGEWRAGQWELFDVRAEASGFWGGLAAVHLNDSAAANGSRLDRHAAIGAGKIGDAGFRALLRTPAIARSPLLLETPSVPGWTHREQLAAVRAWLADRCPERR